ncbi:hypothetical protein Ptr902_08129 [Pyrenophora tritici-repentis]|nr:hypothetical protein L13192_04144 [Pyrenophora tritici-repentis]KAI2479948.1 hypothetical protein Ptr902_08129 [Pyrenophora tritici-repentis]
MSRLEALPQHVLRDILRYSLLSDRVRGPPNRHLVEDYDFQLAILRTNEAIHEEAANIFYRDNKWIKLRNDYGDQMNTGSSNASRSHCVLFGSLREDMPFSPDRHQCSYRSDQDGFWRLIANYWLLPAHLFCSAAVATTLLAYVDSRSFLVGTSTKDAPPSVVPIYQTNVTTLLSIAVTTVRTLAGAWLTLTGWRLAFIILETRGLGLKSFSRLVCYRLPPWRLESMRMLAILWIVFLISVPVQFISPIITGAVGWIPELDMSTHKQVNVTHPGDTSGYFGHQDYSNSRFFAIIQGFALSTLATTTNFSVSTQHISRRRVPSLQAFPRNSSLRELTLPYLNIESLEWVKNQEDVSLDQDLFWNITSDPKFKLSLTPEDTGNPYFHGGEPGRVVIAFDTPWTSENTYPQSKVARGVRYVIVSSTRREGCDAVNPDAPFGLLPFLFRYDGRTGTSRFNDNTDPACYVIARMKYSAGVSTCRNCRISTGGVVESLSIAGAVEPDPLAEQALRMTPDVLALMITSYTWKAWMEPENLDNYTKGMLLVAYQACWNALANTWSNDTTSRQTETSLPYPALTASVNPRRVWIWLLLNCLLTVSGLILAYLQTSTRAKTVRSPELSALLLDTKQIIDKGSPGLCNAVTIAKEDKHLLMRLRCSKDDDSGYQHPYIEVRSHLYHRFPEEQSLEALLVAPKR